MNRILKFRIWNGREFIDAAYGDYGTEYKVEGFSYSPVEVVRRYYGEWDDEESDMVIQQFTGLLDKNGVEIYEGDIVKIIYDKAIGEVYFDFNLGAFRLKDKSSKSYPITTYRFDEANKPIGLVNVADEVIGNIFENSELLKT
jgi:uncharacterized phage protein (TIGR01671 family)